MSDFLSQFDKSNYANTPAPPIAPPAVRSEPIVVETVNAEETTLATPITLSEESPKAAIQGPVHHVQVDTKFQTKQIIKYAIIAATVVAVCLTGIIAFRLSNRIDVKPLIGSNISEARSWALKNRIELNVTEEFDLETSKDIIFEQYPESGKIQRGSSMDITVSLGPDPDERIPLPDFSTMKAPAIRTWISDNKASNARIIQEYTGEDDAGKFLRLEFRGDLVDETNYTRSDTLNIYVSRGIESVNQNITVPNFRNKGKDEVEAWAENNKIKVTFELAKDDSSDVAANRIISQSIPSGTRISSEQELTVVVSQGKGVIVPDFNTISKSEAASTPDLTVEVVMRYSATVPYGGVISQSAPAGTKVYGDDKKIRVVYSEGRPFIEDLTGRSENLLAAYFYELRFMGANITYTTTYVDSSAPRGTVVSASHSSQFVDMSTVVHVQISLGNLKPEDAAVPPNNDPNPDDQKPRG